MFYYVLLFKAKQRFAYLLLIQSVYLFLNVLFLFRSVFHFFKCFRFVSLSKQFDIQALLSKNLYYRWHPYWSCNKMMFSRCCDELLPQELLPHELFPKWFCKSMTCFHDELFPRSVLGLSTWWVAPLGLLKIEV